MADTPHSPEELQRLYSRRFDQKTAYRNAVWQTLCANVFAQWIRPSDTVLDMGCGYGEFINNVTATKKYALDLNPDAKQRVNEDVELLLHDCSTEWPLGAASLDVVFTSNFLEHLPTKDALRATLNQAHRALKPGGRFVAMGPNVKYVPGAYWDFFDHHLALTERSLAEVLDDSGFTTTTMIDRFLPYTMSDGRTYPMSALRAYLKVKPAWKVFGKQFLVVAQRES